MIGTRKRIQLVKITTAKISGGSWGQPTKTRYNYWAEVSRSSGSRNYQNSQTQLGETVRFRIRYNGEFDLSAKWYLVYNGNDYTISSITKENEKQFYWIIEASTKHG